MKKANLFKALIVLSGTGLTYLKYNLIEHLNIDTEYLLLIISALIVIFISTIFMLNKKVYGLKTIVVNPKLKSLLSGIKTAVLNTNLKEKMDSIKPQKIKILNVIEPSFWFSIAIGFGIVLGFYFKEPSATMLRIALNESSEWKKNLFLDWKRSTTSFFQLGDFEFNWLAFSLGVVGIALLYAVIKKTKVISILKSKLNPYLK